MPKTIETIEIRHSHTHAVLFEHTCPVNTIRKTLELAVKDRIDLSHADLSRTSLYGADLDKIYAPYANFKFANLGAASICDAELSGADLCGAYMEFAELRRCNLKRVDLRLCDLKSTDFDQSKMLFANLNYAEFQDTSFHRACLIGANMRGINFCGVNLSGADLTDAVMDGAYMLHANIKDAIFQQTNRHHYAKDIAVNYRKTHFEIDGFEYQTEIICDQNSMVQSIVHECWYAGNRVQVMPVEFERQNIYKFLKREEFETFVQSVECFVGAIAAKNKQAETE